jgi:hypothetical protein
MNVDSRYSDFDIVEKGARFYARGNSIIALPLKRYEKFCEISDWRQKEENEKIVQFLLTFPHRAKGLCILLKETSESDTEKWIDYILKNGLSNWDKSDEFTTLIQCSWCGTITMGFYYPGGRFDSDKLDLFYSEKENCYFVNYCCMHSGRFQKLKEGDNFHIPKFGPDIALL